MDPSSAFPTRAHIVGGHLPPAHLSQRLLVHRARVTLPQQGLLSACSSWHREYSSPVSAPLPGPPDSEESSSQPHTPISPSSFLTALITTSYWSINLLTDYPPTPTDRHTPPLEEMPQEDGRPSCPSRALLFPCPSRPQHHSSCAPPGPCLQLRSGPPTLGEEDTPPESPQGRRGSACARADPPCPGKLLGLLPLAHPSVPPPRDTRHLLALERPSSQGRRGSSNGSHAQVEGAVGGWAGRGGSASGLPSPGRRGAGGAYLRPVF